LKLRIRDNSIRLRLTQNEVQAVHSDGRVAGRVTFGGESHFDYVLQKVSGADSVIADIANGDMTVSVPEQVLDAWANSDQVSISADQALGDDGQLRILVEKDFACLAPREGEDDSDMYPNPDVGNQTC
jgi:hypothetical protein